MKGTKTENPKQTILTQNIRTDYTIPYPTSSSFLTRELIKPWRRTDKLECIETQLPTSQIWVQAHQQMFELQAIAKHRGEPDLTRPQFESPYPQ